jgi:4-hydroxy-tetrahydrodipicolinate synthase
MAYESLKEDFAGVNVVTATPFTEGGEEVHYDKVKENARALVDAGISLLIPCGGVSEYYSLSTEERVGVVEATVEAVGDEASVVAGAGGSAKNAIDLVDRYEDVGADATMLMFPQRPGINRDGLEPYYRQIIESTDLGVMLYKKDVRLDTELVDELGAHENVVAVKHAIGDLSNFVSDVNDVDSDLVWVDGTAEVPAVGFGVEGVDGFTTGIGNFVPELTLDLMDAIEAEDWERARELRELARPFQEIRGQVEGSTSVGVVKHGMDLAGYYGGPVRAPLKPMAEEYREQVEDIYDDVTDELAPSAD